MRTLLKSAALAAAVTAAGSLAAADAIPARPEQIAVKPLVWAPPAAKDHRVVLKKSGVVAYLAENHDLPLVNVQITLKGGTYLNPPGKEGLAEMTLLPPKWEAEMRMNGEADTNPSVEVDWHAVPFQNRDSYALQVLAQILNGNTGRLYKALVAGTSPVATSAQASADARKYAGSFGVEAVVREGHAPDEAERAIYAEIEKLKKDIVPPDELQKVKNNSAAQAFRSMQTNMGILYNLMGNEGRGDWKEFRAGPSKIQAVTAEDVRRVAQTYLTKENRAVATYTRKGGAPPRRPGRPGAPAPGAGPAGREAK